VSGAQALAGRLLRTRRTRRRGRGLVATLSPKLKRRLLLALGLAVLLAAGYQLWLRDSSLVAVEQVSVTGLTTKDAERVRASLTSAAHGMTTLHVRRDELEQAIAAYPVVRTLEVSTDFPHGLEIHVVEHRPAALVGGLPVAGDGTILRGLPVEGKLPAIAVKADLHGTHLKAPAALHAARVAGAAPAALRPRLDRIELRSQEGLVVELRDGPELYFGDATHVRAKWVAATRVLADPDAAGATYIDVRLPGRPAAGGLPATTLSPVDPAGAAELTPPDAAIPPATTVDPATEPLAPTTDSAPAPETGTDPATPAPTPEAPAQTAPPADTTGAGGVSPPPG
jgi:cell division protein FtsQ